MRIRRTWWPLLAFAALAACQTGGAPPQVLAFTADPPGIAAGGSSTLRWLVANATTITIAPDVGDVSGANSAVVTPATTTTYTLTASAADGSDTAQLTVTVDTAIDVAGRVLGLDGRPAPTVLVTVVGVGTATTAADGSFVLTDVEPPYTAHVRHPTEPLVVTYVDLTTPQPVLVVSGTPTGPRHGATFYGAISGGTTFPQPANHITRATFASAATRLTVDADGATGAFQIVALPWYGADTPGALHALQWRHGPDGQPVDYTGHGRRELTLQGALLAYLAQDMAMLPVAEGHVTGTTAVPAGSTLAARTMSVVYPEGGWVVPASQSAPGPAFSYVTPAIPGASIAVVGLATAGAGELSYAVRANLPSTAAGVELVLPGVPQLTSPVDAAANVGYEAPFSWVPASGGVTVLLVNGPAGDADFAIVTDEASARVPDLREAGLGLASAGAYTWQVVHLPRYASVDEAATSADGLLSSWPLNAFYFPYVDGAWASSGLRSFTTPP